MRAIKKFAVAAAALVSATTIAGASQATIYIGLSSNGGAITEVADSGVNNFAAFAGGFGDFELTFTSAAVGLDPVLLGSTSHVQNSVGSGGTLDVYVTRTGISTSFPPTFFSSFTSNVLTTGWTLTEQSFLGTANQKFGGTLLSSYTFVPPGLGTFSHFQPATPDATYSITQRYTVTAVGLGESLATISVAAIPEPGTWALMIMGFGGAGTLLRARRRQAATA